MSELEKREGPVLECRQLSKIYGAVRALDEVDLTLNRGRIIGLLGPNGSGKTTLIKTAAGLLTPSAGELFVNGQRPGPETKQVVSYLPERTYLSDWMRVEDVLSLFSDFYRDFDYQKALEMLSRLEIGRSDRLRTMSKGTKEKVQLILVMSRRADLYLLDEPIGGVDPAARDFILSTIIGSYREDATVLISTHLIRDVEQVLDDVVFLAYGKVGLCAPAEDLREEKGKSLDELFREMYRC
ncbi:MAG: ABC transporter ATP-binding protein [Angelakisella sp.]|jgi:ABC-2 type transport system ATP-binding protein|nr:ABC transporter ATP-binding protein [Angelakisella sp.]